MIAVLADIHANLPALEAVLDDMPQVSALWVLGDCIGEMPFPAQTIDRLIALADRMPVLSIAGNREQSLLEAADGLHPDWWQGTQMRLLAWTCDQLLPHHWAWLRALRTATYARELPGGALLFHGSPTAVRGEIRSAKDAMTAMRDTAAGWLLGGHTHSPRHDPLGARHYVNPGAVGLSLDGIGGVACYALIDETAQSPAPSFRHVPYDVKALLRAVEKADFYALAPGITRATMLEATRGRHYVMNLIEHAQSLSQSTPGTPNGTIEKDVWRIAEATWIPNEWLPRKGR